MLPMNDDPQNPRQDRLRAIGLVAAVGVGFLVAAVIIRAFADARDVTALVIAVIGAVIVLVFGGLYLVGWMRDIRIDDLEPPAEPEGDDGSDI